MVSFTNIKLTYIFHMFFNNDRIYLNKIINKKYEKNYKFCFILLILSEIAILISA